MSKQKIEIEVDVPDGIDTTKYAPFAWGRCGDYQDDYLASFTGIVCKAADFNPDVTGLILRKVEPKRESRWRNLYDLERGVDGMLHRSRNEADKFQIEFRLAVCRIDYENGSPVRVELEPI